MAEKPSVKDILAKYGGEIESKMSASSAKKVDYSREYVKFKQEMVPEITRYERWCKSFGNIIKLKVAEKDAVKIRKSVETAHLDLEPWQPLTLSVMSFVGIFLFGLLISVAEIVFILVSFLDYFRYFI